MYFKFIETNIKARAELQKVQELDPTGEKREDLFHYLFQARDPETGLPYTQLEIKSEASLLG